MIEMNKSRHWKQEWKTLLIIDPYGNKYLPIFKNLVSNNLLKKFSRNTPKTETEWPEKAPQDQSM